MGLPSWRTLRSDLPVAVTWGLAVHGRWRGMGTFFVPQVEVYNIGRSRRFSGNLTSSRLSHAGCPDSPPHDVPGDLSEQRDELLSIFKQDFLQGNW